MADIFISYAKKDRPRVEPIAKVLQEKGWTVWWDPTIPTGKDFDEVIEEELSKARCVIVIWTKVSVKSKYVKGEAREALNRDILVPIEIESGIKPPFDFRSIQTLSLIDWDGSDNFPEFQKLIADIVDILGEPPVEEQKRQREDEPFNLEPLELKPDSTTPSEHKLTEPIATELRKTSHRMRFGVLAGVFVLLIAGIWWWLSQQQVKEVRQEMEKIKRHALNLENAVSKLDKPEQNVDKSERRKLLDDLYGQRDTLNQKIRALSVQAPKVGLESQLEELQSRLEQVQVQLSNKEKELITFQNGETHVIGVTLTELDTRRESIRSRENAFGNLVADAMREATMRTTSFGPSGEGSTLLTDFALINSGNIRGDVVYQPGTELTRAILYYNFPFGTTVELVSITGEQLYQVLNHGLSGAGGGKFPQVSGMTVLYSPKRNKDPVIKIEVDGKAIDPKATYTLATTDFLLKGGDGYSMLSNLKPPERFYGPRPRILDAVMLFISKKKTISPRVEGRLRIVN